MDKLTDLQELEQLFYDLVIKAKELNIVDGKHISIDSTKLDSYKAAKPKKSIVYDSKNPNSGTKRYTNANNIRWFG
ncbi:MAG: hypothetical protein KZY61_14035 [Clostridiaceae bacterium]|nr:hypothetical protein [Clostridiaceae bacterium]MBW4859818.1 hypothetical protein [Clostridiaceae bacterium]MBW4869752.1 hypothetical protein [Clostridiaceae bacterium]